MAEDALPASSHLIVTPAPVRASDPASHNMGHMKLALPVFCLSLFSSSVLGFKEDDTKLINRSLLRSLMRREVETTVGSVSDDFEATTSDNFVIIDEDPALLDVDTSEEEREEGGYDGLANTEINCHKCLRASFNFKKVYFLC